jgi:hypothetical protein
MEVCFVYVKIFQQTWKCNSVTPFFHQNDLVPEAYTEDTVYL